ncbi:MAG: hypothetical protein BBJ57_09665 [Desulfobacterales bacterium PC51MH44]|nr:MAG: hypothetical protein BBJ57_09665 [Desulfobacterales bacterium PC51MH44]
MRICLPMLYPITKNDRKSKIMDIFEDSLQQAAGNALAVAVQRSRDLNGLRAERVFIAFGASLILAKMMLYSAVKIR